MIPSYSLAPVFGISISEQRKIYFNHRNTLISLLSNTLYFTNPCCRLIRIDLKTGEAQTILQEKRWLGHPIYRPGDDNTVAFCGFVE